MKLWKNSQFLNNVLVLSKINWIKRSNFFLRFLFFSAGEDGIILQHDIRAPSNEITKLLLNYSIGSTDTEAKCLSLNEKNTNFLAVGMY